MNKTCLLSDVCAVTIAVTSPASNAALIDCTDQAIFMAALPKAVNTPDFESVTAPFVFNSSDISEWYIHIPVQ